MLLIINYFVVWLVIQNVCQKRRNITFAVVGPSLLPSMQATDV